MAEADRLEKDLLAHLGQLHASAEGSILDLVRSREFGKARTALEGLRLMLLNTPLEAKVAEKEVLIVGMERLHARVTEAIAKGDPWTVPKEFGIRKLEGKTVTGADEDGIHVSAGGVARTVLRWSDFLPRDLVKIYERYAFPNDPEMQKQLRIYKDLFAGQ